MKRKLYIVAYDIRDPSRLAAVLRVVRGFSSGGQKSAYECWLSREEYQALHSELLAIIDADCDCIAFFPLELRHPMSAFGVAVEPTDPEFYYFG